MVCFLALLDMSDFFIIAGGLRGEDVFLKGALGVSPSGLSSKAKGLELSSRSNVFVCLSLADPSFDFNILSAFVLFLLEETVVEDEDSELSDFVSLTTMTSS